MPKPRKNDDRANSNPNWRPVSVYLPHQTFAEVDHLAKESRRSLSAQIIVLLEAQLGKARRG
jgi:hypothetical protein